MKTTRHIGNCQVCEGDFKLHEGRMVHHGYTRPGCGFIVGDCPGVHHAPYEVSCDLLKAFIRRLRDYVKEQQEHLSKLQDGSITELYIEETEGHGWKRTTKMVKVVAGTPEADQYDIQHGCTRWKRALGHAVYETESNIRHAKSDITRCTKRVADWTPKPIRTVEEEQARQDADRAARKAVKDAARAVRDAKKSATKAKQDELEARRKAIREDFDAKFKAIAADTTKNPGERLAAGLALLKETNKGKYRWLALYELRCEEAMVAIGLSTFTGGRNGFDRPCMNWTPATRAAMGWPSALHEKSSERLLSRAGAGLFVQPRHSAAATSSRCPQ